jgi:ubiquitin C-terminal hydrolase
MNEKEIQLRLRNYIKQINKEHSCNFKLLNIINLLAFLHQEKVWFDKISKNRDVFRKVLRGKIKEFNEIIDKDTSKYHENLVNLFHEKSELFLR